MLHPMRVYTIKDVSTLDELHGWFTQSMCLCQGYRCTGLLYLNDSLTSDPDRIWAYAVIRPASEMTCQYMTIVYGTHIDTITTNGFDGLIPKHILASTVAMLHDATTGDPIHVAYNKEAHTCPLCA